MIFLELTLSPVEVNGMYIVQLISPYSITTESNIKFMKIVKMIAN